MVRGLSKENIEAIFDERDPVRLNETLKSIGLYDSRLDGTSVVLIPNLLFSETKPKFYLGQVVGIGIGLVEVGHDAWDHREREDMIRIGKFHRLTQQGNEIAINPHTNGYRRSQFISFCGETFEFVSPSDINMVTQAYFRLKENCEKYRKKAAEDAEIGRENARKS